MNTSFISKLDTGLSLGRLGLGACMLTALAASQASAVIPPVTEDFDQTGWLELSGQYVEVDGRDATFRQRHQMPTGASGGVESFYWENFLSNDVTMVIEGRSIFDENENFLNLRFTKEDTGFISVGFKETRTWYDGSGGYYPPDDLWFEPVHDEMFIDRGEFWIAGGLAIPDIPLVTLRYSHSYRRGLKDSTVWGRAAVTAGGTRGIRPSFREIDETKNVFDATVSHEFGNTTAGLGGRYEVFDQDNTLDLGNPRHNEQMESDAVSGRAWTKTEINEKTDLSTGYMYTKLDTDIGGDRLYDPPGTGIRDYELTDIRGGAKVDQHVVNVSLMSRPWEHFAIIPSLRAEKQELDAISRWTQSVQATATTHLNDLASERDTTEFAQRLELRYTGLERWHLFARGDWMQADGDLQEVLFEDGMLDTERDTDFERTHQTYTVGAQWYPTTGLSFSTQYARKIRENDYDHPIPGGIGRHPAFLQRQDFTTDAFNIRATIRPTGAVTLVSRYGLELTEIESQGSLTAGVAPDPVTQVPGGTIKSGDRTRHSFNQSVSWMPLPRLFLLGSVNYVIDSLETPASEADGAAEGLVLESENDFLVANLGMAFAYSERTDFNVDYFYYIADNYEDNSGRSVPYGVGEREHGVTANMVYRIDSNLLWKIGYGFFNYRDKGTWGGNRDYDAHLAHTGITVHF